MIGWIVSAFVIIGMALMTHKKRACFVVFILGNLVWYFDLLFVQSPIQWSYVTLVTIYTTFNLYGWILWTRDAKKKQSIS